MLVRRLLDLTPRGRQSRTRQQPPAPRARGCYKERRTAHPPMRWHADVGWQSHDRRQRAVTDGTVPARAHAALDGRCAQNGTLRLRRAAD